MSDNQKRIILGQGFSWGCSQSVWQACCLVLENLLQGVGESVLAVCGGPASYNVDLSLVLLEYLTLWHLASPRPSDQRRRMWKPVSFHVVTLKVIHHYFCNILLVTQVSPVYWGKGLHKGMDSKDMTHWGHLGRWLPQCKRMILYLPPPKLIILPILPQVHP